MEKELVKHFLDLESCLFEIRATELRKVAENYELLHRFNKEKQISGKKWYYKFKKDSPSLSLRTLHATSMARAKAFNIERELRFKNLKN